MSEHHHGPAPTNDELGLSFRRTDAKTREKLQEQRGPQDWEPIERMVRSSSTLIKGTVGADVVVDARVLPMSAGLLPVHPQRDQPSLDGEPAVLRNRRSTCMACCKRSND